MSRYVYVASSWRNPVQPLVVKTLQGEGVDCYDFRNPPNGAGFGWEQVGRKPTPCPCNHTRGAHGFCGAHGEAPTLGRGCSCPRPDTVPMDEYLTMLDHPRAIEGFEADFTAMQRADTFVLVLPCGRSAHLELGWAVGAGKRTAILLDDPCTPELMYRMVDHVATTLDGLLAWL